MKKRAVQLMVVFIVAWQSVSAPLTAFALEEQPVEATEQMQQDTVQTPVEESKDNSQSVQAEETAIIEQHGVRSNNEMSVAPSVALLEEEEPDLILPELLINRVVAGKSGQSSYEYIELYNPNPREIVLDSWQLVLLRKDGSETKQTFSLTGTVKPNGYILFAGTDSELDAIEPDFRLKASSIVTTGGIIQLINQNAEVVEEFRWGDTADPSLKLLTGTALARIYNEGIPSLTGDVIKDFKSDPLPEAPQAGGFVPYVSPVNYCEGIVISDRSSVATGFRVTSA